MKRSVVTVRPVPTGYSSRGEQELGTNCGSLVGPASELPQSVVLTNVDVCTQLFQTRGAARNMAGLFDVDLHSSHHMIRRTNNARILYQKTLRASINCKSKICRTAHLSLHCKFVHVLNCKNCSEANLHNARHGNLAWHTATKKLLNIFNTLTDEMSGMILWELGKPLVCPKDLVLVHEKIQMIQIFHVHNLSGLISLSQ
jgi:hypothetical protein